MVSLTADGYTHIWTIGPHVTAPIFEHIPFLDGNSTSWKFVCAKCFNGCSKISNIFYYAKKVEELKSTRLRDYEIRESQKSNSHGPGYQLLANPCGMRLLCR